MIYPRKWIRWRPGFLIPVFFLASSQLSGQGSWPDAETAALGRCYATRSGHASAGLNQAGLGRTDKSTCSLHHSRPFISSDLDIVSLSLKLALKWGGPGLTLSTMGITGMRQTSAWVSYGLMLHPRFYAGAGIHLQHTSISEDPFRQMGAGFALGIQFMVNDEMILGAHATKPTTWTGSSREITKEPLMISSGFSYLFYKTARYHTEFHVISGKPLQWCNGLEIKISDALQLLLGMHNQPWTLSAGMSLKYRKLEINLSGTYCMDTGTTPYTSISYEW